MKGKTCVITGATSGIGWATALALGNMGASLVLLGRNQPAGQRVAERIRRGRKCGKVDFLKVDLSVQDEVRTAARRIGELHDRVDVLINNAGARFDLYQQSADGLEMTFATNHLSHFLLTSQLLEAVLRSPAARIITVASGSHGAAVADGKWQLTADNFDRRQAYAKSKLANILFAYALADRFKQTRVVSNAADPGGVASNFARNNGLISWARHLLSYALRGELISPSRGAQVIVYLAGSAEVEGVSGKYYRQNRQVPSSAASHDVLMAQALWELSLTLTGIEEKVGAAVWSRIKP